MQLALPCLVLTLATITFGAIKEIRPVSNRPGRFLSLPVPNKCSARKYPCLGRSLDGKTKDDLNLLVDDVLQCRGRLFNDYSHFQSEKCFLPMPTLRAVQ